jgi:precorrin-6B methylase 2
VRRALQLAALIGAVATAMIWFARRGRQDPGPQLGEAARAELQFMEGPLRAERQRADAVVSALRLGGGEKLVDVGAGAGTYTVRFARALPRGKVVATEVNPEFAAHVRHRSAQQGLANVEVAVVDPADPGIPGDADVVFVANVLHVVLERAAWLRRAHDEMRPGARLAVVQFDAARPIPGLPADVMLAREPLVAEVQAAGFALREDLSPLLPHELLLVFERPGAGAPAAEGRR